MTLALVRGRRSGGLLLVALVGTLSCGESGGGAPPSADQGGENAGGVQGAAGGEGGDAATTSGAPNEAIGGDGVGEAGGAGGASGALSADGDEDGDGLDNATEQRLQLDPESWDTDDDGFTDAAEVGDPKRPTDTDGDGIIDALESDLTDNDRDGVYDSGDPAAGWQVAAGRFYPHAIANDGNDATRLEVVITGEVQRAALQTPAQFYDKTLLPNELEVDGKLLGNTELELYNDGSHGDRFAGDNIWTRGGITTHQAIRCPTGERDSVLFVELLVTTGGKAEQRYIGISGANDAPNTPVLQRSMGFALGIVDSASISKARSVGATLSRTPHLLNIVNPELAVDAKRAFIEDLLVDDPAVHDLFRPVLEAIPGDVDFVVVFPETAARGRLAGAHLRASVDASGTGLSTYAADPAWGAETARFKAGLILDYRLFVPLNHEIMHQWGVYLSKDLGFGFEGSHWGVTSTFGVLGGFDPKTFVDNKDGTYSIGFFEVAGNDWRTTPFSPLELYLAGWAPATDVAPVISMQDAMPVKYTDTAVVVKGTKKTTTIQQIIAKHGARVPAFADAEKAISLAFAVYSPHPLSDAEMSWLDLQADFFGRKTLPGSMSFYESSGGRATAQTVLPKLVGE